MPVQLRPARAIYGLGAYCQPQTLMYLAQPSTAALRPDQSMGTKPSDAKGNPTTSTASSTMFQAAVSPYYPRLLWPYPPSYATRGNS